MGKYNMQISSLESSLQDAEHKLLECKSITKDMEHENIINKDKYIHDLSITKTDLNKQVLEVYKTQDDLRNANCELNNLSIEMDQEYKQNNEFQRINQENATAEIKSIQERIKQQQEVNSNIVHDLKVYKSQIQQKIDQVAYDLNILSLEKDKYESMNKSLKDSINNFKQQLEMIKDKNIDLSQQKLNLIEALELQDLQKKRQIDALLALDFKV